MALCSVCQRVEVFSTDPERDVCVPCFMSGDYFDAQLCSDERSNMLTRIRELPNVVSARIWHAGQGAFQLAITLEDGRMITPGAGVKVTAGQRVVMPFIVGSDQTWGVLVQSPVEAEDEWSGAAVPLPEKYDDDELVQLVSDLSVGFPA